MHLSSHGWAEAGHNHILANAQGENHPSPSLVCIDVCCIFQPAADRWRVHCLHVHCDYLESGVFPRSSRQRIFLENRQPPRLRARRCKRSRGTNSAPKSADEGFSNGCARSQKVPPPRRSPKHRHPSCSLLANGASARAAPRTLG